MRVNRQWEQGERVTDESLANLVIDTAKEKGAYARRYIVLSRLNRISV